MPRSTYYLKTHRAAPRVAALACAVFTASPVVRANEAALDEKDLFAPLPIIMSATRLPQPALHSPVSSSIITREIIEASGFTEIPDLFRLVPGFQVAHATGGHTVVAYHGQERTLPEHIEVLVDGRSVYGNLLSTVNWNAIGVELEDVEQIEIIRGPNAPVFGSNALGATIHIKTRQPYAGDGTWVHATAGSLDTAKVLLRHAHSHGDRLDYRITAGFREDTGYSPPPDKGPDTDSTQLASVSMRGNYKLADHDDLDFSIGYTRGDTATFLPGPEIQMSNHDGDLLSHHASMRWTRALAGNGEFYVQAYHNRQHQSDAFDFGPLSAYLGVRPQIIPLLAGGRQDQSFRYYYADGVSDRFDVEFQHAPAPNGAMRAVWGGGARLDRLESPHLADGDAVDNSSARLFGNIERQLGKRLFVNTGAMVESNEITNLHGSARIAANYRVSPTQSLRASVSHAQRSPSILEENWDTKLNFDDGALLNQLVFSYGGLQPERLTAYEIGYSSVAAEHGLQFDVKAFLEEADAMIGFPVDRTFPQLLPTNGTEIVTNDDAYFVQGIEGQVIWKPSARDLVSLQYSLTTSQRDEARTYPVPTYRKRTDTTPAATWSVLAAHGFGRGYSASAGYYHVADNRWLWDGDNIPSYDRVDVRLAKSFKGDGWNANLELVAQNLAESYLEYVEDRTLFETRYYVKASVKY